MTKNILSCYHTGNVPANKNIWVIGDKLLNEAAGHYQRFKPKPGEIVDDNTLYIERRYNLKRIPPGIYSYSKDLPFNAPELLISSFIDTLNEPSNAKLPDILLILWNDYRFWNNELLLKNHMSKIIRKFIKELKKIAEIRNDALPEKAANWQNPRIFISNPLPLPNNMGHYPMRFKANRRKFTRILQKGSAKDGYTIINFDDFTSENANKFFHQDGAISEEGFTYMWTTISDAIHTSDKKQEILSRKAKAKELAASFNISSPDKSDLDGVWSMEQSEQNKPQENVRRCLSTQFDNESHKSQKPSQTQQNNNCTFPHQRDHQQSSTSSQANRKFIHHHKPKRGRGPNFYGPPPGFFPFNPFFPFPPRGMKQHFQPY